MSKAAERYKKNQELLKGWLISHPEYKELVSVLQEVTNIYTSRKIAEKLGKEITDNVNFCISIGQAVSEKEFISFLSSYMDNPKILFSSLTGKPYFIISDDGYAVVAFTLEDIRNIWSKKETDASCNFDRWCFRFSIEGKFDYEIYVTIYKE